MALTYSKNPEIDFEAPDFILPNANRAALNGSGQPFAATVRLSDFKDQKALVVIFMCNHCPYVIAVQDRINDLARMMMPRGVGFVGINSNDVTNYPADSFPAMQDRSREKGYVFPYLWDESQAVAQAYRAACTPDPYFFENVGGRFLLRYHGRIDDNWKNPAEVKVHDLRDAMEALLAGKQIQAEQKPAMGCNIKWKQDP